MKFLFAILFCIGLMSLTTLAQSENELENHYHEIQFQTEGLHTYMKGTIDNLRIVLSDTLYSVNENSLESALVGIRYVDEIVQIVDQYISQSTGSQVCIDGVLTRWAAEKNIIGSRLSQCSQMAEDRIVSLLYPLHDAAEAAQRVSHAVQNLVIRTLAIWNPLDHEYGLDYLIELELDALYLEFTTVTVPGLQQLLEAIAEQDEHLPLDVYSCSATAANDFNAIASGIQTDAWLC